MRLALLALRYGRTEELTERLPAWEALLVQLHAAPNSVDELPVLFRYLFRVASKSVHPTMKAVLKNVVGPERTEELMETLAEMYEERGRQQGKAEGHVEARANVLVRLLTARGIHVDAPTRQRIMSCMDIATLDQWFDRAVNATQLSEVFADLTQ